MPLNRSTQTTFPIRPSGVRAAARRPGRLGILALALLLLSAPVAAQKPPTLIRQHLLDHPDLSVERVKSVEPHTGEALDAVVTARVWKVAYKPVDQDGESLVFMAVTGDGEVVRIRDFDEPASRDGFVELLRDDFRVRSAEDARRLVSGTLELYFGFPFSEPERTAEEMRFETQGNTHFLVDGERFGDATGYRIETDDDGRVVAYAYSWELPVAPLEE